MKKSKFVKRASLVALSAVMVCGTAVAFAGCGDSSLSLSASIFCSDSDFATNQQIADRWAESYSAKLRAEGKIGEDDTIKVELSHGTDTTQYFDELRRQLASGDAPDVFYVSPKYVKTWAKVGRILDLSEYMPEENKSLLGDIWEDSLAFYGYSDAKDYQQGERIAYKDGKFQTVNGTPKDVGVYGLPKDYSNFGLGFNNVYFSQKMRTYYETYKPSTPRTVKSGATNLTYGADNNNVITYAASGTYTDKNGTPHAYVAGQEANIINVGIPVTYKPYNFYKFTSFTNAVNGGDPMAIAVQRLTGGKGYTVTIPGYPGDTFEMKDGEYNTSSSALYDTKTGHVTFTYAEYSALTWAVSYFANTFAWCTEKEAGSENENVEGRVTQGQGGVLGNGTTWANVYGNDQYDGVLYLLPWLAGNDATYINQASTSVTNSANATEAEQRTNIKGEAWTREIQYGMDSEKFLETYGAFTAYGSDWNGNSNNAGDIATKDSGWNYFCAGALVFYGAGTWDMAEKNKTDYKYLQFMNMPEPVSEKYAIYSEIKQGDYSTSNTAAQNLKQYGTLAAATNLEYETIRANQVTRQDKWGARMDSVGYGVNAKVLEYSGSEEWKKDGAVSLVCAFTIDKDAQETLTYAGAQLPNFKSQCVDFLKYNEQDYTATYFSDMTTPDDAEWNTYYETARKLKAATDNNMTVSAWMAANASEQPFDSENFGNTIVKDITDLSFAMKVLKLSPMTRNTRDLNLRMQIGLNAVRDSSMYTYDATWLSKLDARSLPGAKLLGYTAQDPLGENAASSFKVSNSTESADVPSDGFWSPYAYCKSRAPMAQTDLNKSISDENDAMSHT